MKELKRLVCLAICLGLALLVLEVARMPHGQRDWAGIGAEEVTYGLSDMGELAARLGSIVTFNREGNVLLLEDFRHGDSAWSSLASGAGGAVQVSNTTYRSPPYSFKLVGGSDESEVAYLSRYFPYPVLSRYGLEFSMAVVSNCDYVLFVIRHYDGATLRDYQIKYDDTNTKVQVKDDVAGWVDVATDVDLTEVGYIFDDWKLVVDLSNNAYVRLILNADEYDLSAYTPPDQVDTTRAKIGVVIYAYSVTGYNATVYVDDIILTNGEPE